MRAILPVLAIAIAFVAAVILSRGGVSDSSLQIQNAGLVANVAANAATPTPLPTATATPGPCPYCDQDPNRWRELTDIAPPDLLGTSAVLMEGSCGEVLYGLNWRDRREPASLAKVATAMVVADNARLDDIVDIQINGWDLSVENESTIMGLEKGMRLSVEELLYGLLLPSGNDAALELSRYLGGEAKVVALMNQRVAELGLDDTHFVNSHGLDAPGAYTTPFDMAVLGRALLQYPLLRQIVGTQFRAEDWHDNGGIWNGNYLIYIYDDAIGIKTGYTEAAGWSIVSAADRDGRLLIASVFNSGDIYWDSMRLFDWAYENTPSACGPSSGATSTPGTQ